MGSEHTPGPWEFRDAEDPRVVGTRRNGDSRITVAVLTNWLTPASEVEANGRLIAAAPDLLAALDALVDCCVCPGARHDHECMQARAAIARARGTALGGEG